MMCRSFSKWILFVFLVTMENVANAGTSFTISDSPDRITAVTARYQVVIEKPSYAMSILAGRREILRTTCENGKSLVRGDNSYRLQAVRSWRSSTNSLFLTVETTLTGIDAEIVLSFFNDSIQVQLSASDHEQNKELWENLLLKTGGHWYGGNVTSAHQWPLETGSVVLDPFYSTSNQTSPIWLTSSGTALFVPTYQLMGFSLNKDKDGLFSFHLKNTDRLTYQIGIGANIVDAFYSMIRMVGKPRLVPPKEYFSEPIFNSWIEFHTDVTQEGMENYVTQIKTNGFPCKIVEIDDKWTPTYGDFIFDPKKFPDPKKMIEKFHSQGLKVILWATPFFEKASANYAVAEKDRYLVMDEKGKSPYTTEWWNGSAGLVDFSNPQAYTWYLGLLQKLEKRYGVDGYKLDGGDGEYLAKPFTSFGQISSLKYTDLFASLGQYFEINELRVSWLTQELGLLQRLRDKDPTWSEKDGLNSLIPHGLTEGLIGYQYFCPDMIGGGLDSGYFGAGSKGIAAELFVRWAQASTFMPMMQFSYAPWRMEDKYVAICRKYAKLHADLGDTIYDLAVRSSLDGTPIVRPLFFRNPEDEQCYSISSQFMLGDRFMVAPVLSMGATSRDVYLPSGTWADFWNGTIYQGGQTLKAYPAPLEVLPVFISLN